MSVPENETKADDACEFSEATLDTARAPSPGPAHPQPLFPQRTTSTSVANAVQVIVVVSTYIMLSALLIRYNKYLMNRERFPYPMVLTALHMAGGTVLSWGLYFVAPSSFFPTAQRAKENWKPLLGMLLPIALAFAVSLYFSNVAYIYCGVAFLQFMKEANLVIVFLASCALGLQTMTRERAATIFWIMLGSSLAVGGDLHFLWIGVGIQALSQVAECTKLVMAEMVLGRDYKLDPMTYTMCVAPLCLVSLSVGVYFRWTPAIVPALAMYWRLLIPNVLLAFCMNVTVAVMYKVTSAMGVVLAGVVKDVLIVVVSSMLFGEAITFGQSSAFLMAVSGVLWWSYMKLEPDSAPVQRFRELLHWPKAEETLPLKAS